MPIHCNRLRLTHPARQASGRGRRRRPSGSRMRRAGDGARPGRRGPGLRRPVSHPPRSAPIRFPGCPRTSAPARCRAGGLSPPSVVCREEPAQRINRPSRSWRRRASSSGCPCAWRTGRSVRARTCATTLVRWLNSPPDPGRDRRRPHRKEPRPGDHSCPPGQPILAPHSGAPPSFRAAPPPRSPGSRSYRPGDRFSTRAREASTADRSASVRNCGPPRRLRPEETGRPSSWLNMCTLSSHTVKGNPPGCPTSHPHDRDAASPGRRPSLSACCCRRQTRP